MKTIATIFLILIFSYSVASEGIEKTHYTIFLAEDEQSPAAIVEIPISVAKRSNIQEYQTVYGKDKGMEIILNSLDNGSGGMIKDTD